MWQEEKEIVNLGKGVRSGKNILDLGNVARHQKGEYMVHLRKVAGGEKYFKDEKASGREDLFAISHF